MAATIREKLELQRGLLGVEPTSKSIGCGRSVLAQHESGHGRYQRQEAQHDHGYEDALYQVHALHIQPSKEEHGLGAEPG